MPVAVLATAKLLNDKTVFSLSMFDLEVHLHERGVSLIGARARYCVNDAFKNLF